MPQILHHDLTLTAPAQQQRLTQLCYNQGGSPVVYLQAGVHADEYPAMAALEALRVQLDQLEAQGRITGEIRLVPIANPLGLQQFVQGHHLGRYDADSGINFNRGYPDLIEALARAIEPDLSGVQADNDRLIRRHIRMLAEQVRSDNLNSEHKSTLFKWACDADYLLDVHCDDQALPHLYASKRAASDLQPLADALEIDVVMLADDSGGASFDEAAPGLWAAMAQRFPQAPIGVGCRGCTIELRGQQDVSVELAEQDAAGILRYLGHIGAVTGSEPIRSYPHLTCDLEAVDLLPAPVAGLVHWQAQLGTSVKAGDLIAEIWPLGQTQGATQRVPVVARNDGKLFTLISRPYARAGQTLAKVAGREPLSWRSGFLLGD